MIQNYKKSTVQPLLQNLWTHYITHFYLFQFPATHDMHKIKRINQFISTDTPLVGNHFIHKLLFSKTELKRNMTFQIHGTFPLVNRNIHNTGFCTMTQNGSLHCCQLIWWNPPNPHAKKKSCIMADMLCIYESKQCLEDHVFVMLREARLCHFTKTPLVLHKQSSIRGQ
jgi:hypothetical protein